VVRGQWAVQSWKKQRPKVEESSRALAGRVPPLRGGNGFHTKADDPELNRRGTERTENCRETTGHREQKGTKGTKADGLRTEVRFLQAACPHAACSCVA
jgi:hypothetical protein